jgi:hypothetical protein
LKKISSFGLCILVAELLQTIIRAVIRYSNTGAKKSVGGNKILSPCNDY